MRIRSRREEGQVYPALLLAVIGGFAIAVSFIPLQNLLDQTGRADSAADSAALAAAEAHRDQYKIDKNLPWTPMTRLSVWLDAIRNGKGFIAQGAAQNLATANGADLEGVVQYRFEGRPGRYRAVYTVITRQEDTVKGGDATANSRSRATAIAEISNSVGGEVCGVFPLLGVDFGDGCHFELEWTTRCIPSTTPPPPDWCFKVLPKIEWKVRLVENDDSF